MQFRFPRYLEFNPGRRHLGSLGGRAPSDFLEVLFSASGFVGAFTLAPVTSFYIPLAASVVSPAR